MNPYTEVVAAAADNPSAARWAEWYADARAEIATVSHGLPTETSAAAVFAFLSPQNPWAHNVRQAKLVLDLYRLAANRASFESAIEVAPLMLTTRRRPLLWNVIRSGRLPETTTSPKIRAFFANLSGDDHAVTVDVHMARVYGWGDKELSRVGAYERLADLIREAARAATVYLGYPLAPAEAQALIWVAARGAYN